MAESNHEIRKVDLQRKASLQSKIKKIYLSRNKERQIQSRKLPKTPRHKRVNLKLKQIEHTSSQIDNQIQFWKRPRTKKVKVKSNRKLWVKEKNKQRKTKNKLMVNKLTINWFKWRTKKVNKRWIWRKTTKFWENQRQILRKSNLQQIT